jgi:hypothetical protein
VRTALALGALAFGTSPVVITSLPRPAFPGPAPTPSGAHRLVLVSSHKAGFSAPSSGAPQATPFRGLPLQTIYRTANRLFLLYGKDGSTGRYLLAATKTGSTLYGFDFGSYGRPPRIKPGDRDLVWEQPMWAQESGGVLYVETAHLTYAEASYGRNGYVTAIDLKSRRILWRSPALVGNANTFLVTKHYLVTGYGFTDEPDYLYLLDRATGKVVDRLLLPNAPERITWQVGHVHVHTYDHNVVVLLRGE